MAKAKKSPVREAYNQMLSSPHGRVILNDLMRFAQCPSLEISVAKGRQDVVMHMLEMRKELSLPEVVTEGESE